MKEGQSRGVLNSNRFSGRTDFNQFLKEIIKMKPKTVIVISICLLIVNLVTAEQLENGFRNPPISAKPSTWW